MYDCKRLEPRPGAKNKEEHFKLSLNRDVLLRVDEETSTQVLLKNIGSYENWARKKLLQVVFFCLSNKSFDV